MENRVEIELNNLDKYRYFEKIYKKNEGKNLKLYVFEPAVSPVSHIIFIHGGGWRGDYPSRFFRHCAYCAERRALAVSVDYEPIGNGRDVRDILQDCIDAVRFVSETYGERKTVVVGESAGGYMAACLGNAEIAGRFGEFVFPSLVVDYNGIVDLKGKWNYAISVKNNDTESKEELLKEWSPVDNVSARDSEVYCIHGNADTIVDINDSVAFVKKLNACGVRAELDTVNGAEHSFILFDYMTDNSFVMKKLKNLGDLLAAKGFLNNSLL